MLANTVLHSFHIPIQSESFTSSPFCHYHTMILILVVQVGNAESGLYNGSSCNKETKGTQTIPGTLCHAVQLVVRHILSRNTFTASLILSIASSLSPNSSSIHSLPVLSITLFTQYHLLHLHSLSYFTHSSITHFGHRFIPAHVTYLAYFAACLRPPVVPCTYTVNPSDEQL